MTKKDVELIARIIEETHHYRECSGPVGLAALRRISESFADELQEQNPRFNRVRFLAACQPT